MVFLGLRTRGQKADPRAPGRHSEVDGAVVLHVVREHVGPHHRGALAPTDFVLFFVFLVFPVVRLFFYHGQSHPRSVVDPVKGNNPMF